MADLKIIVDSSDVVTGVTRLQSLERGYKKLDNAFNKGKINAQQYAKGVQQIDARIDALTNSLKQATVAQDQFGNAAQRSTRRIGQGQVMIQQAGYQIGDFIVQVQSGTNAFVAFGQQATQVAGTLTLLGGKFVAIGAALSIVIPLATALGAAWMRTRKDSEDSMTAMEKHVESLEEDLQRLIDTIDLAGSAYSNIARLRTQEELLRLQREMNQLVEENPKLLTASERVLSRTLALEYSKFKELENQISALEELNAKYDEAEDSVESIEKRSKSFSDIMQSISIDNLLSQMDSLNSKLGTAVFGAGTLLGRLRGAFDAAVAAANRAKAGQDLGRMEMIGQYQLYGQGQQAMRDQIASQTYSPDGRLGSIKLPKSSGGRGGGGSKSAQESYLSQLMREAEQKRKLVGLSEEETRRQEIIFELEKRKQPIDQEKINKIVQLETETRKLIETEEQRLNLIDTMKDNIESAFMSIADGSKSVVDAFRSMLRNIILAIFEQQVAKPAANVIGNFIGGLFQANGGAWNKGVQMFANGGVVNGATAFGYSGGIGVMGEAGPEAIMPLKRGPNGKLGVEASGQSLVINQSFNFSANGDDSVKRIIRGEIPRITEATKAAVVDSKRRGGTYGRAF